MTNAAKLIHDDLHCGGHDIASASQQINVCCYCSCAVSGNCHAYYEMYESENVLSSVLAGKRRH